MSKQPGATFTEEQLIALFRRQLEVWRQAQIYGEVGFIFQMSAGHVREVALPSRITIRPQTVCSKN